MTNSLVGGGGCGRWAVGFVCLFCLAGQAPPTSPPPAQRGEEGGGAYRAPPLSAEDALARISRRLGGVGLREWCFRQESYNASLGDWVEEEGELYLSLPGRMRWAYRSGKLVIADGQRLILHLPQDRTAYVGTSEEAGGVQLGLLLLSGSVEAARVFAPSWLEPVTRATEWELLLRPRLAEAGAGSIAAIRLVVSADKQLELKALHFEDAYGNRTRLHLATCWGPVSRPAKEELFRWSAPPGTTLLSFAGEPLEEGPVTDPSP